MDYGERCQRLQADIRLNVKRDETVWIEVSTVDNRLLAFVDEEGLPFRELFKKTNPPDGNHHGPYAVARFTGGDREPRMIMQGYNEPKASPFNPWRFDWRIFTKNANGVETWSEPFSARCSQDGAGSWSTIVLYWQLLLVFVDAPPPKG